MKMIVSGALFTVLLVSAGCYTPPPPVAVQTSPPVVEQSSPPIPAVPPPAPPIGYVAYGPDYYVWDGTEYIGVSGGNYVYWTGGTWVVAPPVIVSRFHGWQRYHPDWHRHAVRYRHEHEPYR